MAYTITQLVADCRAILNDVGGSGNPQYRYPDTTLLNAFNDAMQQVRSKRPDAFIGIGLRNAIPQYVEADITGGTAFPLDGTFYPAFVFYVTGRTEMQEDTFADDNRAGMLMAKFTAQLLQVSG